MRSALVLAALVLAGCAGTGATWRSGVGDVFPEHPPWSAGTSVSVDVRIGVLPVVYQQHDAFDPEAAPGSAIARLVTDVQHAIDSLGRVAARLEAPRGTPPDVVFGCARDGSDACVERGDSVLGRRGTRMHLALRRPSPEWSTQLRHVAQAAGVTHALVVSLEVGDYWVRQDGLLGHKRVALGRHHVVALPWLTSLEMPVRVLQFTAALVDRDGRGVRISVAGIAVRRTSVAASSVGLQRQVTDEDVEQIRRERREDLPGAPLAWRVALEEVLAEVVGP